MLTLAAPVTGLSEQVQAYVAMHWQRMQETAAALNTPTPSGRAASAEALYAKLVSYRFTRQKPSNPEAFLEVIQGAIRQQAPIPIILGHGPLKNMNNCEAPEVDWAEFFTLSQWVNLQQAIQALYPPGVSYTLFLDDARAEAANGVPACVMARYLESLKALIAGVRLEGLIPQVVSFKEAYQTFRVEDYLVEAEGQVLAWETEPENASAMEAHTEYALRNMPQTHFLTPDQRYQQALASAHRYRVYYQAEVLAGLWSIPNTLYGRFSPHPGFWQLYTLRKGSMTQPWQGKGCLGLNSKRNPEPFLLTRQRRKQVKHLETVATGLPLPGFQTIEVWADPI